VPVWDKGERTDGTFSRSDFNFDEQGDSYTCPNGKQLKRSRRAFKKPRVGNTKANTNIYRASKLDCETCPFKQRCCPNTPFRKVSTQTGRDAVCSYETRAEDGSSQAARPERCPRRVLADCGGTKSQTHGQLPGDRSACCTWNGLKVTENNEMNN